jgi:hypothetical protein
LNSGNAGFPLLSVKAAALSTRATIPLASFDCGASAENAQGRNGHRTPQDIKRVANVFLFIRNSFEIFALNAISQSKRRRAVLVFLSYHGFVSKDELKSINLTEAIATGGRCHLSRSNAAENLAHRVAEI